MAVILLGYFFIVSTVSVFGKEFNEELCLWEIFKSECSENEVAVISAAQYGRMNVGRCLEQSEIDASGHQSKDPRYYGCQNNVKEYMERKCSFEKSCEMKIKDLDKLPNQQCFPGLKMFLKLKYFCIPVLEYIDKCHIFLTSTKYLLLGDNIKNRNCDLNSQLVLEAPSGQRIRIALLTIGADHAEGQDQLCHNDIGIIIDAKQGKNYTICQNGIFSMGFVSTAEKIFVSKANVISLTWFANAEYKKMTFELGAEGCLDVIPPEDTWLKRNNDEVVIGCYSSKQAWNLKCENGQWTGSIGNCSSMISFNNMMNVGDDADKLKTDFNITPTAQTLVIITICISGFIICVGIICMGAFCTKRIKSEESTNYYSHASRGTCHGTSLMKPNRCPNNGSSIQQNNGNEIPINDGILTFGQSYVMIDEERYQVLDQEEVVKE